MKRISRILIANRGEIANRVLKTLTRLRFETVVIYHDDEKHNSYLKEATYSVSLGSGSLHDTFLNINKIIEVAKRFNVDAIHPGYGFLSENSDFANACETNNITFIGPSSEVIGKLGIKKYAKNIAKKLSIPILAYEDNAKISYPLVIKAVAGGGGKGLRVVHSAEELKQAMETAKREAKSYFNNDEVMLEPFIEHARHIEVQILADYHGNCFHLYTRECSIQRNQQKIIEEAPACSITQEMQEKLCLSAIAFASEVGYTNAGTIEFLVKGNQYYFLEMNTRIQVEHAVTELITGVDIVEQQVLVASGESLVETMQNVQVRGHAIEARIYAEDPYNGYSPSTGRINAMNLPMEIRVDSFIHEGINITPWFDSMLGKIIAHSRNRKQAIDSLQIALNDTFVAGVTTNKHLLLQILDDNNFYENRVHTKYLEEKLEYYAAGVQDKHKNDHVIPLIATTLVKHHLQNSANYIWRNTGKLQLYRKVKMLINATEYTLELLGINKDKLFFLFQNQDYEVKLERELDGIIWLSVNDILYKCFYTSNPQEAYDWCEVQNRPYKIAYSENLRMASHFLSKSEKESVSNWDGRVLSPFHARVVKINVLKKQKVNKGDTLLSLEAMKTENAVVAPGNGIIDKICCEEGNQVVENAELIIINCDN
ncbi:MAG: ATP-grasp domain-containing protein [Bacteroidales bacterium]|nr:ATP-grasp domain-containing protein [Bacteroidales bacterium]